ncbi:MAG: tetratricopeptide repeat protein, partial [Thermoguttaceae bacterium]
MNRCYLTVGLFLGLLAHPFHPLAAAELPPVYDPSDVPLVAPGVRQAMQDRNFADARKAIDEAAKAKDAPSDYLAYLRAWSLYLEKQHDQAIAALEKFEKDFPQSKWFRRSRFAKAQAMVAKSDFRGAQAIYEQEAKYLLSAARRQQSAAVYVEFAEARFQSRRGDQQPDYKTAREFYALALDTGLPAEQRAEVEFRVGYCLQRLGNQAEAAKSFEKFLADHTDDPRQMEARYRLGECLLATGKPPEARKAWRELLAKAATPVPHTPNASPAKAEGKLPPTSPAKETTHHDWQAEAAFHLAETWHGPKPRNDDDLRRGVAALEDFINRFPTHELVGTAHLQIAQSQVHLAHYDEAAATLQHFLQDPRWKDCKELPQARWSLGQVYHGQKKYAEALAVWREYLIRHTSHEGWSAVQQSIIDTEYLIGLEKFKAGDDAAATKLLAEFMDRYPLDPRNPGILYMFGQIHHRQKMWETAIADWQRLVAKYPRSEEGSQAQFMIARTLEEQLNRYDEAREHYRLVTGRDAAEAGAALAAIPAKSMQVKTERVFRSSETPQLKLATRNVASVKVRVYKIDLETYFRKMHSIAGIQRLDVSLIDPDTTLEFAVPGFARYEPLTSSIPVPLPDNLKAGVAALTVSGPTLETTTLLIQSDLEILVKSSRDEVLIFAENVLTGKPWPGVRLLISDGRSVFAETKTGDDGFFRQHYTELRDAAHLRVFAAAEGGHMASTALRLDGESIAHELADRIYVETDRRNYFPGETVHVRGCARHADGGRFTLEPSPGSEALPTWTQRYVDGFVIEPGKKLTVEVLGDADRRLRRREVTLSGMGTFSWDFFLPAEMPEGAYKVVAYDQAGHRQATNFQIGRPEEETLHLVLDLPKTVYYRGEIVEGSLHAVLPQDRPLAGVKVTYKLGDEPMNTATTDARGEVHFAIPTAELESYGPLKISAAIPSRSVSVRRELTVATQGFSIGLETSRPVFVVGESIDVCVKTTDAAGRPSAEKLLLKVVREAPLGETTRKELVEEHPLATAADGTARMTLKLAKGGMHVIRATGTDRFGNTIAQDLQLRVSGDDDPQRLLLLVDRTNLKAGDTAEAQIYWRGQPVLAVVTCHFDRLIQQRQIALQTGTNRLQIPVTAAMAPGFTLAVSVMADSPADKPVGWDQRAGTERSLVTSAGPPIRAVGGPALARSELVPPYGNRLHEDACMLRVDPDLQVKIECHRHGDAAAAPRPGEPADVTVTTCDAQGKPVSGEVGLAVLAADRGNDGVLAGKSLATFFLSHDRTTQFQTASSIQFHYQPANRAIGTAEPDEDVPAAPAHIASQQGVPVAEPAAADNPSADFAALEALIVKTVSGKPAKANPFGDDETPTAPAAEAAFLDPFGGESAPAQDVAAAARQRQKRRSEPESTVSRIPRPTWSGYWNPSITTGLDGRATISLTLPDDAENLTLAAQAITPQTLAGQVSQNLVLKKELSAVIHLPPAFTDGDEVELPVVVQNQVLDQGRLEVTLSVNVDGVQWNEKKTLDVKSRGRLETSFKTTIRRLQRPAQESGYLPARPQAVFTVTAKAGAQIDVCRHSVPVLPYGNPCRVTATGIASGQAAVTIAPSRRHWATATLQIAVSPTIQRSLLDLLAPAIRAGDDPADTSVGTEGLPAASDLMAALALAKLYPADSTEGRMLDERIGTTLSFLIAAQHNGTWSIESQAGSLPNISQAGSLRYVATNALAFWSLVLADKAGFEVPHDVLDSALARLRGSAGGNQESDLETKSIVLHALAIGGQGDFALANHLLRDRKLLSPLGRAYLALALLQMDRKETAADVLKQPEPKEKQPESKEKQPESKEKDAVARQGDIEARALTALALLTLDPASPRAKVIIEAVLSQRTGLRWTPDKVTGPAVLAAATWLAKDRAAVGPCRLAIAVNGKPVKTLDLDPQGPTQTVDVPLSLLVKGQQRIKLHPSGPARLAYRCTLEGVDPAEFVQGNLAAWSIRRSYKPGPMEIDEIAVPRGFSLLSGDAYRGEFSNRMTQLPAAHRGSVELEISSTRNPRNTGEEIPSPSARGANGERRLFFAQNTDGGPELLVVEPLPSGTKVVESSLDGCFDRAEILPGRILFFLNHGCYDGSIRYELEGVFPSSNLISPTILRRVGHDAPLAVAKPKSLVVLPQGARSTDPYRLSPDELLSLGAIAKRKGDIDAAIRYYTELLDSWHGQPGFGLSDAAYKQTIFALMELGMGRAAPARLVQYCEVIKEKWPGEPVTLDQLLTAAAAYREIGEIERSYMACRAAVEGSFTRESGVAGFLDTHGEFLRSVSQMDRLLSDYPPEPYLAEA